MSPIEQTSAIRKGHLVVTNDFLCELKFDIEVTYKNSAFYYIGRIIFPELFEKHLENAFSRDSPMCFFNII